MGFDEVRLPTNIEIGAQGGPQFNTTIIALSSGFEKRNINWADSKGTWDIGYSIRYKEDLDTVIQFFYARRGRANGFRFKDWSDFELPKQLIGIGDATNTAFQVFKRYTSGGVDFDRTLTKLVTGTLQLYLNNVLQSTGYTVDYDTGLITFASAPGNTVQVSVACEFDVPVRFDTDKLNLNMQMVDLGSITGISLVELKL